MGSQSASRIVTVPSLQSTVPAVDADAGSVPVFWIYVDDGGRWCLRKEGGAAEAAFNSRAAALAFVRDLARTSPSYRLFIETEDGRIIQEPHTATEGHAVSVRPREAERARRCRRRGILGPRARMGKSARIGSAREPVTREPPL